MGKDKAIRGVRQDPGAFIRLQIGARGLEFWTRFAACVTLHKQSLRAIADNFRVPEDTLRALRRASFDMLTVDRNPVWVLKPEARQALDFAEHFHRRMYDETRAQEQRLRTESKKVKPSDPIDELDLSEHNRGALKEIRRKLGAVEWVNWLALVYDPQVPPEVIADSFPKVTEGVHDSVIWRRVLTNAGKMSTEKQIHVTGARRPA